MCFAGQILLMGVLRAWGILRFHEFLNYCFKLSRFSNRVSKQLLGRDLTNKMILLIGGQGAMSIGSECGLPPPQ